VPRRPGREPLRRRRRRPAQRSRHVSLRARVRRRRRRNRSRGPSPDPVEERLGKMLNPSLQRRSQRPALDVRDQRDGRRSTIAHQAAAGAAQAGGTYQVGLHLRHSEANKRAVSGPISGTTTPMSRYRAFQGQPLPAAGYPYRQTRLAGALMSAIRRRTAPRRFYSMVAPRRTRNYYVVLRPLPGFGNRVTLLEGAGSAAPVTSFGQLASRHPRASARCRLPSPAAPSGKSATLLDITGCVCGRRHSVGRCAGGRRGRSPRGRVDDPS